MTRRVEPVDDADVADPRLTIAKLKLTLLARAPGKEAERAALVDLIAALEAEAVTAPTLEDDRW